MPAIFGAFGNFLLPTQLGVHDVAFPRLNSAAFWFLPGGLIMLCQLVCVDRRYQRMNCFNIRELQGILKRKFFTDLVNTSDSHKAVESTLINMRHKNNMSNILLYDQSLFYNFDLTNTSKYKSFSFNPGKVYTYSGLTSSNSKLSFNNFHSTFNFVNYNNVFSNLLKDLMSFIYIPSYITLTTLMNSISYLQSTLLNALYINLPSSFSVYQSSMFSSKSDKLESLNTQYNSSLVNYSNFNTLAPSSFSENSSS
jgi:hypothetical protein